MSTLRYRSSWTDCNSRAYCTRDGVTNPLAYDVYNFDYAGSWPLYWTDSKPRVDLRHGVGSEIYDSVSPKQTLRVFNECDHAHGTASIFNGHYRYTANRGGGVQRVNDIYIKTAAHVVHPEPPSVPWGDLVTELGQLVRDRLGSGYLLGATVKELGETIEMVRNPFNLLRHDWRHIVGNLTAKSLAQSSANIWLEYQYGWKAGLYDLKCFCKAMARTTNAFSNWSASQARESRFSKGTQLTVGPLYNGSWVYPGAQEDSWMLANWGLCSSQLHGWGGVKFGPCLVQAHVGCKRAMEADTVTNRLTYALTQLGCTSSELLPTLWEVLPYSFVVDWFVNIGSLLKLPESLAILGSARCRELGYSFKFHMPYTTKYWPDAYFCESTVEADTRQVVTAESSSGDLTWYKRQIGLPQISLADFCSFDLSATHLVSGTGLILQRILH